MKKAESGKVISRDDMQIGQKITGSGRQIQREIKRHAEAKEKKF